MNAWNWRIAAGIIGAGCVLAATTIASADDPPDYGFDWVTVGAPGNRAANQDEAPRFWQDWNPPLIAGAVDYEYRIQRSQVTVGQWFEFVNTYGYYLPENQRGNPRLTGQWIVWDSIDEVFRMTAHAENYPSDSSFQNAARFVNWLHNGKVNERWAFEDGVYDTSTFTENPDFTWNSQEHRKPGSKFWIPSHDEWVKAFYYDPDRYGPGEEGYWLYPDGGNDVLVSGWPWEGGETGAGLNIDEGPVLDVGSYPWTQSPWGLLDASGAYVEHVEDFTRDRRSRLYRGSDLFGSDWEYFDRIDWTHSQRPVSPWVGLRLASPIPEPATSTLVCVFTILTSRRRRT